MEMDKRSSAFEYIRWFEDICYQDVGMVGGKTASLGEMYRNLDKKGVKIPNGFGVTSGAYWLFLQENNLKDEIQNLIKGANLASPKELQQVGHKIRHAILAGRIPDILAKEIIKAYKDLVGHHPQASVAIRSSATAEDLPDASFAGQQETYLNVKTEEQLITACKQCFASLFTDRAISYREHKGFNHFDVALSICVQLMIRSDLAASGVMFSIDTETGFENSVLINGSYGLGENIVQGTVNPDEFYVFKPTLKTGHKSILQKHLGSKEFKLVYDSGGNKLVKNLPVSEVERKKFCITDEEILLLAKWACEIEDHYTQLNGKPTPMDMEWGKDGLTGELFILQARPETVQSQKSKTDATIYQIKKKGAILASGRSVGDKIGSGKVRVINQVENLSLLQKGEVLVTDKTDPDWEPMMKHAAAIVTNRGGRTCHAAIVSRELGLPAVVGTENATQRLQDGDEVTVSCAEGEVGYIYEGICEFETQAIDKNALMERPKTKVMVNLANPEEAFHVAAIPNDGVGLARMEFIINHHVKVHPMALVKFEQLQDLKTKYEIEQLTEGYTKKTDYFVDKLSQGIGMIAAAFNPKDVIVRMSDFKTNEYANLIGGSPFEPAEENPMIGFRGASRYYNKRYREGFALECQAIRKVREEMGLENVKIMIPFCRTIDEAKKVFEVLEENGLKRGKNNLEVYVMCEIPSNVILAEQFAELFDGFSIGSNDLTQLTLGIDRDSEILTDLFDERNDAVLSTISEVIQKVRKKGRKIGICGQAPSDYPKFSEFLVKEKIHSISLTPDTLTKTTLAIKKIENSLN